MYVNTFVSRACLYPCKYVSTCVCRECTWVTATCVQYDRETLGLLPQVFEFEVTWYIFLLPFSVFLYCVFLDCLFFLFFSFLFGLYPCYVLFVCLFSRCGVFFVLLKVWCVHFLKFIRLIQSCNNSYMILSIKSWIIFLNISVYVHIYGYLHIFFLHF